MAGRAQPWAEGHNPFGIAAGGGAAQCTLNNCTLTRNYARASNENSSRSSALAAGGGAVGCTLSNCTLIYNTAAATLYYQEGSSAIASGGGVEQCTLYNCTLRSNSVVASVIFYSDYTSSKEARGGGASECTLYNCTLSGNSVDAAGPGYGGAAGGGAYSCRLNNCTLSGNSGRFGGGAYQGTLNNCTLTGNSAPYGGGAASATLSNCALTGNSASFNGGGASGGTPNNCIVFFNSTAAGVDDNYSYSILNSCCTTPQPTNGFGNITNVPLFVDTNGWANLRLQSNSPCINAGNNAYALAGSDLDGNPRIVGGTVDIGAYEYQAPVSQISYAWLQQFGLPINAATDSADPDGDGVDNYHEWLAGTDPTNRFSSPAQLTILPSGTNVTLTWATNAVGFTLQSATDLTATALWTTNLPAPVVIGGQNVVTNPVSGAQQFYRLIH
jgi:hypothetical protein